MYLHRRDHEFSIKEKYNINPGIFTTILRGPSQGSGNSGSTTVLETKELIRLERGACKYSQA